PSIDALARFLAQDDALDHDTTAPEIAVRDSQAEHAAIAVIGLGCRFPGADGPAEFWRLLRDGVDAISEVPADRWKIDDYYSEDATTPGTMNTRWGGFLTDVDRFDRAFFG